MPDGISLELVTTHTIGHREAEELWIKADVAATFGPVIALAHGIVFRDRSMPRYFFHFRKGNALYPDEWGVELAGIDDLRAEVTRTAGEMLRDAQQNHWDVSRTRFEVVDEDGEDLFTYPLVFGSRQVVPLRPVPPPRF